ncbi:hypothetical protein K2173_020144 [Erythroxylum novogranatense]|uniref:CCHC-type domain-containing protein n=1 Tax=Erythroxylum novogranatense TaxID=1862640 RepID=A0AAV8UAZ6_9ROSI|nr:hypothetical protein K2173_020144 [Erythroxylum novogranatense]
MSNLAKIEFAALDVAGHNYMPWMIDVEMHLESMDLLDTIKENNTTSKQNKAKAMIFIRRHLDEGLKREYLTIKDPSHLWKNLQERYDHQKEEDMLEKTYSTFHASNVTLQQQYRVRGFKKYSDLISCLLVVEKNNELLMKNHQFCPTGATAFPEANITIRNKNERKNHHGPNRGRGRGRGRGHGRNYIRGRGRGCGRGSYPYNSLQRNTSHHNNKHHINDVHGSSYRTSGDSCLRCGTKGHWAKVCRVPEHLCQLYKASLKGKKRK